MKTRLPTTMFCFALSIPALGWITNFIHQAAVGNPINEGVTDWLQALSSMGFAGLVWYWVTVKEPKDQALAREERQTLYDRLERNDKIHRDEVAVLTAQLAERISDQNKMMLDLVNMSQSGKDVREVIRDNQ